MNFLLEPGIAIYLALAAALAVWLGIFVFLWRIDQHVRELERRVDQPRQAHLPPSATLETRSGRDAQIAGEPPMVGER